MSLNLWEKITVVPSRSNFDGTFWEYTQHPGFSVEQEYVKNPSIKKEDIQRIMDWIQSQPHLPANYISELDVILAYHACDQNSEVTKQVIDKNYTLRTLCTFYQKRKVNQSLKKVLDTSLITVLDTPDVNGNKVIYCQLLDPNPKNFNHPETIKVFTMVLDLWQHQEGTIPGLVVIINLDGVVFGHISRIDHSVVQQILYYVQEALLVCLKKIHVINAPVFMDLLMNIMKPFMNNDLLDKLSIHQKGSNNIFEKIKRDAFPKEIGGSCGTCLELRDKLWKNMEQNRSFFDMDSKKVVNENKRPGKQQSFNSLFGGIEGTFKKLEID